jgi:NAD+ synthase
LEKHCKEDDVQIKLPENIKIDPARIKSHLVEFIKGELKRTGFHRLVVGVSGGLDSAVVANLAAAAIGAGNVTGVIMPYRSSNPENVQDAELVIKSLGINRRFVEITPMVDAYFNNHPTEDKNRRGNKMARERMSVLYDISAELGALVIGTSNKSEIKMGYGTLFGDLACALNPIGNLYKTQIRQLAKYLNIPEKIITKAPSADLWEGQTDEGELGLTYEQLDTFLFYLEDQGYSDDQLKELGFAGDFIEKMKTRIRVNEFKGRLPVIASLPK